MELIEAKTLTTTAANFTFSSIPATYTDLCIVVSARSNTSSTQDGLWISQINGSGSNLSNIWLRGSGSSAISNTSALYGILVGQINAANSTASTFSNLSIYIPNYASANNKSISIDSVQEHNATEAYMGFTAGLWSNSAAITSITLDPQVGDLVQHSTAYLYGISNVTSTTKATGGIVSSDGTYNYHMFPFSGTFTPTTAITADYLVIAGGGSGGACSKEEYSPGGGGAGALRYFTSQSLTAQAYTVTVGAGGAGRTAPNADNTSLRGNAGSDSTFNSSTSTGGGGGGGATDSSGVGGSGGSGGGGEGLTASAGGSGTTGGNNGGTGNSTSRGSGGGGGAGATGGNGTSVAPGAGGAGLQYLTFATATNTGANNGYYAGGGGGVTPFGGSAAGGLGGGGAGVSANGGTGVSGTINTGGGGGAVDRASGLGGGLTTTSGSGGSGLVIIRYAI
jgi:hypothetical protein